MTTWKPDPQTYEQALHEIGSLEQQVADLQEQLTEAHQQIAALTEAKAADVTHNARLSGRQRP
jgi:phage shock protein A